MKKAALVFGLLAIVGVISVAIAMLQTDTPFVAFAVGILSGIGGVKAAPPPKALAAASMFEDLLARMHKKRSEEPWNPKRFSENPYLLLDLPVEDWTATPEGRFAHEIKIPNPVPADSGYRPGMTQQQYFEHLCKTEAGEFIFKTVDNVDTIMQMRPRKLYVGSEWAHLYAIEDPYGHFFQEVEDVAHHFVSPRMYTYFEIPVAGRQKVDNLTWGGLTDPSMRVMPPSEAKIARYFGYDNWSRKYPRDIMKLEFDVTARARYGFTWRGIKRPFDREMGIGGGELIVLDLKTQEVLGVRRGYAVWNRGWTNRVCPRYGYNGGEDKGIRFTNWFLLKVARSPQWEYFFKEEEKYRRVVGNAADKRY